MWNTTCLSMQGPERAGRRNHLPAVAAAEGVLLRRLSAHLSSCVKVYIPNQCNSLTILLHFVEQDSKHCSYDSL
jgi:hypothetical protein